MQISTVSSSISSGGDKEIPSWIRNNADWWSQGLISDDDFVKGIQYLVEHGIIQIPQILQDFEYFDFNLVTEGIDLVEVNASPFLTTYGVRGDYVDKDGERTYDKLLFELKEEHQKLYEQLKNTDQKTIVVFPIFTATAYDEPGFYTYYRGVCDASCLTPQIQMALRSEASGNAAQILKLLDYNFISDIDIDKNPEILDNFEKIILLHSEYVTRAEFDAITNHPNVVYLYPNALYAEITVDYDKNAITLIRGHSFPDPEILNGFDWKFDNTHPYEFDIKCEDWQFYEIDNGFMLNCFPEIMIYRAPELLQFIKEL